LPLVPVREEESVEAFDDAADGVLAMLMLLTAMDTPIRLLQ